MQGVIPKDVTVLVASGGKTGSRLNENWELEAVEDDLDKLLGLKVKT
jgi:hypothetical protein